MQNETNEFYKRILDHLYDGVYFVDRDRLITYWNQGAERISGYSSRDVLHSRCYDNVLMHVDANGQQLCFDGCPLMQTIEDGQERQVDAFLHHHDGHRVPVSIRVSPMRNEQGDIVGAVEVFNDNSAQLSALEQISEWQQAALIDALTGCGNRRYTTLKLQSALLEYQSLGSPLGVLFADIDHFKRVNDTYGHETGDQVLHMVAQTLMRNVQPYDFVGRWGGEEFVLLLPRVGRAGLLQVAERLRLLVEHSQLNHAGGSLQVTLSLGGTLARPEDTLETLIARADAKMYESKAAGRNRVTLFESEEPAQTSE